MTDKYILAVDQGTTSTRAIVFNHEGRIVGSSQMEHEQIFPRAGWVEHNAKEIWDNAQQVIAGALAHATITASDLAAVGITNQRETTLVWNKKTAQPVYNAIVWQDTRTAKIVDELGDGNQDKYKAQVGLPLATYFSGPKVKWVLDNVEGAREAAEAGDLVMGNMDTWLIWNLTGGPNGGKHYTDVTNASRTMLMNLDSLSWNESIAADMGIPMSMLPEIKSSSEVYGEATIASIKGVPVAGDLGDQQAATFGQACFEPGMAKNTYGTGCFMISNTGSELVPSKNGLLTTVCYKIGDADPVYALEGSIAVTGSLVQWLRDNLKMIESAPDIEKLAATVEDNGGCYVVPAFSGLFAPYWKADARGAIVGLTRYVNRGHIARAVLEATAFQTREVLDAMEADSGVKLAELKVDGGMTQNDTLMQFQADVVGVPVVRPVVAETTALGAAYAAGIAVGYWNGEQ
ncbi:MAG TPA: glycerol kinase GlpK, partial [Propionibacteriaceae bacterium]|nr:glycerol kinase GlpK [Propionibacteriaceae bacterium]